MAHNFQKIYAPFGRANPKDKLVDVNIYSRSWVKMFYENNVPMLASEKIDGTSVGIVWDGERISFIGHTEKTQFAPRFLEYLNSRFGTPEFESVVEEVFGEKSVILYGEGISKDYNCHYGNIDGEFIFYDVFDTQKGTFYNRPALDEIAQKLGLKRPWENVMTIKEAVEFVKTVPESQLNSDFPMEGLVLRSMPELMTNNHERIICKVKVRDFVS